VTLSSADISSVRRALVVPGTTSGWCNRVSTKNSAIIKTDLHITQKDYYYIRLFHIYHLSCQQQLTTKWKLGFTVEVRQYYGLLLNYTLIQHKQYVLLYSWCQLKFNFSVCRLVKTVSRASPQNVMFGKRSTMKHLLTGQ
jgi:hypothetical protein